MVRRQVFRRLGAQFRRAGRDISRPRLASGLVDVFLLPVILFSVSTVVAENPSPPPVEFNRDVRPIFADNCFACHGPDKNQRKAEFRLDKQDVALSDRGGYYAIVPGKPDAQIWTSDGFEPIVVTEPIFEQLTSNGYGGKGYQHVVVKLCAKHGIDVMDPLEAIRTVGPSYARDFVPFDGHPTGRVYGALADALADALHKNPPFRDHRCLGNPRQHPDAARVSEAKTATTLRGHVRVLLASSRWRRLLIDSPQSTFAQLAL